MDGISEEIEVLARRTIGAAIEVHTVLGAGYLESVYQEAMQVELARCDLPFRAEHSVRVDYKGERVGMGRLDLLVHDRLIVELKAVEKVQPIHKAQVIQYLKVTELPLALLLNFKVRRMKDGIKRVALTKPRTDWRRR